MRTLKYCLINCGFASRPDLHSGVGQWVGALGGELVAPEALGTPDDCAQYDLIHVVYGSQTSQLITAIRACLGRGTATLLVVSLPSVLDAPDTPIDEFRLRHTCALADLLLASDHATVRYAERVTEQRVYCLPHPAHLRPLKDVHIGQASKLDRIAFLMPRDRFEHLNRQYMQLTVPADEPTVCGRPVDVICGDIREDANLLARVGRYAVICLDVTLEGHDAELLYLAGQGCALIGGGRAEVIQRCFSLSAHVHFAETLKTLDWLLRDEKAKQFLLECAADKLEYFNYGNSQHRLINVLAVTCFAKTPAPAEFPRAGEGDERIVYLDSIQRVSGAALRPYARDEFVVVCLVRDGKEFLPSFLRHYRRMGARHFFFIDNGSTDDTRTVLGEQLDVTVYKTALKHKRFESEIRRVIIERHCQSSWCMCVDIDELLEYPGAGIMPFRGFLNYLNTNGFTAVVAYMLDMFVTGDRTASPYLEDIYTQYDLTTVTRGCYFAGFEAFCDRNVVSEPEIGNYYGGVRQQHVKSGETQFLLTKHSLVFIDRHIEAVTMPHFCNHARIADVTCLLKHYKLTASLGERIKEGIRTDTFSFIIKDQIAAYVDMVGDGAGDWPNRTGQAYQDVDRFVENGFLHTSVRYRDHLALAYQLQLPAGAHPAISTDERNHAI